MTTESEAQTVIVGAGVIGLAIARKLARLGHEVIILEAEDSVGHHTSGRNSQVIHAGMYYPVGSLRARFCVEGKIHLYDFCQTRHVDFERVEKLIVATRDDQMTPLKAIYERGLANGVSDLKLISAEQAVAWEPELFCSAAIYSPSTGIVDVPGLMLALLGEAEAEGAFIVYKSPVLSVQVLENGFRLEVRDAGDTVICCKNLINAAGLGAWDVARNTDKFEDERIPPQSFAKGNYVSLSGVKAPFRRLIYPVPEDKSLGVHYVRDLGGQVSFGPDLENLESNVLDYRVDPARIDNFIPSIRKFWPGLPDDVLQVGTAGIRPRISMPGQPAADFMIQGPKDHGYPGLVQLFGIESPGMTSSLAIAQYVAELI